MIPLVHERLVDLLEQSQSAMKAPPNIRFRNVVSARRDAHRHTPNGVIFGGKFDEVENDAVARRPPRSHVSNVHRRRKRGLDSEAIRPALLLGEPSEQLTARRDRVRENRRLDLNLVRVQKRNVGIERRKEFARESGLPRAIRAGYDNRLWHIITKSLLRLASSAEVPVFSGERPSDRSEEGRSTAPD